MTNIFGVRFPPRKILVPMDLSEASQAAWSQALELARRFDSQLEALYVQPWLYTTMDVGMYSLAGVGLPDTQATGRASEEALGALRARLGPNAVVKVVPGAIEETIEAWEKDPEFDLIVMSTHGRTWFERAIKGSIAEAIVRGASLPVLVIRGQATPLKSILAPINFEPYANAGFAAVAEIAAELRARLKVLHVVDGGVYGGPDVGTGPNALLGRAVGKLPEATRKAVEPVTELAFGKAADKIIAAAEDCDVIALVAHSKGFWSDAVLGTTVERVLRHSTKPVLALPAGVLMGAGAAALAGVGPRRSRA